MTEQAYPNAVAVAGDAGRTAEGSTARRWRPSITATLTVSFGLLFTVAWAAVLVPSFFLAQKNTFDLLQDTAVLTVGGLEDHVNEYVSAAQTQTEFLADLMSRGALDPEDDERLSDVMLGALSATPQVSGIAFVRADYRVIRVGQQDGNRIVLKSDWSEKPEIRLAMENTEELGRPTWRGIAWADDFQAPHIAVAEPVYRDGVFLGMLFSVVSISALSSYLAEGDQIYETHSFILYGRDQVIAHKSLAGSFPGLSKDKPLPSLSDIGDPVLAAIWQPSIDDMPRLLAESQISGRVVRGADDDYIYLFRELQDYGEQPWRIGVYFRGSEVEEHLIRLFLIAVSGFAILLAALTAIYLLGRRIARPIKRLAGASAAVQHLELRNIQPLEGSVLLELDSASRAYNAMIGGLRLFETYVPRGLVLRLMRLGADAARSDQRTVSVLFTDIAGFTGLSSRLAPHELAEFLNRHFALAGTAIDAEGGTVDKYIGDSVMAFWNAPQAQPDHASRACRAALAIAAAIEADNRARSAAGQDPVRLRIGIHSGPVIVGNIGAPGRVNYTLIGDTVNVAQRLEGLGKELGQDSRQTTVLVSGQTAALLEDGFVLEPLGQHQLRGRASTTEVFRLNPGENRASA